MAEASWSKRGKALASSPGSFPLSARKSLGTRLAKPNVQLITNTHAFFALGSSITPLHVAKIVLATRAVAVMLYNHCHSTKLEQKIHEFVAVCSVAQHE